MNNNLSAGWNDLVILYVNQKYFKKEFFTHFTQMIGLIQTSFLEKKKSLARSDGKIKCAFQGALCNVCA